MNVAFDLDGVLYPWHKAAYTELVIHFGLTQPYEEFWSAGYKTYRTPFFWDNFVLLEHLYGSQIPDKKDVAYVQDWNKYGSKIFYITGRDPSLELVTRTWLKKYKFPQTDNLIFNLDKATVCLENKINLMFEDQARYLVSLSKLEGLDLIVVNQPFNQDFDWPYRVNHIYEAKDLPEYD